jgi:imidazolonepropionase-like amidohydrolase
MSRLVSLTLLAALVPTRTALPQGASANAPVAFVGVNVIPMDTERVLQDQTVVIRDGRIAALGPRGTTAVPQDARRMEAAGRYLLPGLAEMHAHIPSPDSAGRMGYAEEVLFLYVAHGVTTIRGMLGHPAHLDLRRRVESGSVLGPRIWTSGPSANGNTARTAAAGDSIARANKTTGYDFIKIHPGVTRAAFDALDAAADQVGIPFSGHVPQDVGLMRALEARYASIDHLDGYMDVLLRDGAALDRAGGGWFGANWAMSADEAKIPGVARATRDAGVWNVPTQTLMESYATDETVDAMAARAELSYMPPRTRANWRNWKEQAIRTGPPPETMRRFIEVRRRLIKSLHDAGAGLLLGSDAPQVWNVPGFSVHRELESLVQAGLTPYQALETGTRNVARFFGVDDRAGTITVGKQADLLLLEANPLADISNTQRRAGVMIRGQWLARPDIDARLAGIAERYRTP